MKNIEKELKFECRSHSMVKEDLEDSLKTFGIVILPIFGFMYLLSQGAIFLIKYYENNGGACTYF